MKKLKSIVVCVFIFSFSFISKTYAMESVEDSLVKILVTKNFYSYYSPWTSPHQDKVKGSGFVFKEDGLILTNAHVVADATFIEVKLANYSKSWVAEVLHAAHEYDLAVIQVKDSDFQRLVKPLLFAEECELGDQVRAIGFPIGGEEICITKGIISRKDQVEYAHSGYVFPIMQIDSAINPGNSGGPVLSEEGKVVGVAHQGMQHSQNVGYMIPLSILRHFFKQIEKGRLEGFPFAGLQFQSMENTDLRNHFRMGDQSGILITYLNPNSYLSPYIKPYDVILQVDDHTVMNDGTIIKDGARKFLQSLLIDKVYGDTLFVKLLRDGEIFSYTIPIENHGCLEFVPPIQYDQSPEYYIICGFVFQPLNGNYIQMLKYLFGDELPALFQYYSKVHRQTENQSGCVVLNRVLPHESNRGYQHLSNEIVDSVNNRKISSLDDLRKAIEENNESEHTVILESGNMIIFKNENCQQIDAMIFQKYGIHDRQELTKKS